ncbi:COG0816 Predicted endonuclease involved in recombination (possible Holliday junction resolvase in Mycoplasmas and B. subtilis) [Candidatus Nanopelagicaceae bacterium]|jgi:putative holliday junction resolvase
MERGRRIAFDYGDIRIGVAICDADGIISSPLTVLATEKKSLISEIKAIFVEYEPIQIFVGLPKHLSGVESTSAEKARIFGASLSELTDAEIIFIDERLSTVSAQSKLKEAGKSTRESKELIDAMAAVEILELGLQRARSS